MRACASRSRTATRHGAALGVVGPVEFEDAKRAEVGRNERAVRQACARPPYSADTIAFSLSTIRVEQAFALPGPMRTL